MYGETIWISVTLIILGISVIIIGFKNNNTGSTSPDYSLINMITLCLGPELAKVFFIRINLFGDFYKM
jgi:hypothetical protein